MDILYYVNDGSSSVLGWSSTFRGACRVRAALRECDCDAEIEEIDVSRLGDAVILRLATLSRGDFSGAGGVGIKARREAQRRGMSL